MSKVECIQRHGITSRSQLIGEIQGGYELRRIRLERKGSEVAVESLLEVAKSKSYTLFALESLTLLVHYEWSAARYTGMDQPTQTARAKEFLAFMGDDAGAVKDLLLYLHGVRHH